MEADILIVGQGIAGSALAYRLMQQGLSFVIADNPVMSRSTRVAAGLFNPLVFKRLTESWRAEEALKEVALFYRDIEARCGLTLLEQTGLYRIHGSEDERRQWAIKRDEDFWAEQLGETESAQKRPWLKQPFDGAMIHSAGFVHTQPLLESLKKIFESNGSYLDETFEYSDLKREKQYIEWKDHRFKQVVFCEGHLLEKNPFFPYGWLKPAKGDVLVIEAPGMPQEAFNGKVYGVPLGANRFKVGSTYEWTFKDDLPSEEKRAELVQTLGSILNVPFTVVEHDAGIRPSSTDRRPLFGPCYEDDRLFVFNGLGTKGLMLAPLLSREVAAFFQYGVPIPDEYHIDRFQWKILR